MYDDVCEFTGMECDECPCMWCHPPMFFFKYLVAGERCEDIDCVIRVLEERVKFFEGLKEQGLKLMGPIDDHYAVFEPPDDEEAYWVQCRSGGCYLEVINGKKPPSVCPTCGKNVLEYEG